MTAIVHEEPVVAKEILARVDSGIFPKAVIVAEEKTVPALPPEPKVSAYKKLQEDLRKKCSLVWAVKPENNKPGKVIHSKTGVDYEVQKNGSWRRLK